MNNFNAVRLCLSLLVILAHSYEIRYGGRSQEPLTKIFGTISFGELAVNCFFIVSGYLILGSWHRSGSLLQFIWRRFLRVAPAFIFCYLISGLIVGPAVQPAQIYFSHFDWLRYFLGLATFSQPQTPNVFVGTMFPGVNVPLWSIQYEVACYCLLAGLGVIGALRTQRCWIALFFCFGGLLILGRVAGSYGVPQYFEVFTKSYIRLPFFFFAGGIFYLKPQLLQLRQQLTWALIGGCVALIGLTHSVTAELGLASGGALAILSLATHRSNRSATLIDKLDISYGLYLYAWPVSQVLYLAFPGQGAMLNFLSTSLVAAALALFSWRLIEEPSLKMKRWPIWK